MLGVVNVGGGERRGGERRTITFTHVLTVCQKNLQHDRVKPRGGGSRAVYTMCKKTSNLVADGFP